jgi:hypothetical protein
MSPLLNTASSLYVGEDRVSKVYSGAIQVWPVGVPYDEAVMNDAPSAYWPLATNFVDVAGGRNGSAEHVSIDQTEHAAYFDGRLTASSRSRIVIPNVSYNVAEFTVEAMAKVDSAFAPPADTLLSIITKTSGNSTDPNVAPTDNWPPAPFPFNMMLGYSGGQLQLVVDMGDGNPWGTQYKSGIIGTLGDWIHLMVTADRAADELLWYVNGQPVSTPQTPQRINYTNMVDSVRNVIIGDKGDPIPPGLNWQGILPFQGWLKRMSIYDYALTPAMVLGHYHSSTL